MTFMGIKGSATIEDLLKTPKDGHKYELVDGKIVVSPAGMRHSEVACKILYLIQNFLEQHPIGKAYTADVGIVLPNENVRSPDVTYVRLEKLPNGESPETFGHVVPDLAVEVLSPGDSARRIGQKIGEYFECGVPLVWLVDPRRKTVTVYRSLSQTEQLSSADTITAEPILPGFSAPVSKFF